MCLKATFERIIPPLCPEVVEKQNFYYNYYLFFLNVSPAQHLEETNKTKKQM